MIGMNSKCWSSLLLGLVLASWGSRVLACSSCGSGGADPVILNPNESSKLYLGLTQQSGFLDVNLHGERRSSFGPDLKQSMDLAAAQRLGSRVFASAVLNFARNVHGSQSETQIGDVTLNSRATLVQQNFAEPLIPQVQLLMSHRFGIGRSVYQQRREHFLDVFGAGYDETYVGADLWFGMTPIMAGGSVIFGFPGAAHTESGSLQLGRLQKLIGTLGFLPSPDVKLIGGFIREQREGSELNHLPQADSDKLDHDLFLTMETLYTEGSNFRLSVSKKAAFGSNKNAVVANVVAVGWMLGL